MINHDKINISVITPVFNSQNSLFKFYNRLSNFLDIQNYDWELIFVDDNSTDESWIELTKLHNIDNRVKCIRLGRNQGQQHATLCGIGYAKKAYVITIDDDLQCFPEDISIFIEAIKKDKSVVIGKIPIKNKKHVWWRKLSSNLNNIIINKIIKKPKDLQLSSFRCMTADVAKKLTWYKGAHPHIAAMIFKIVPHNLIGNVEIRHAQREDGQRSTYTFSKLLKTISYLIINHSYLPLRFMIGWGITISFLSMAYAIYIFISSLLGDYVLPGWTSLAILISFLSGNILLALGIIGEYLGRLVEEATKTSQFAIFEELI